MKTSVAGINNSMSTKSNLELIAAIDDTLRTSLHISDGPSFHYHEDTGLLEVPDLRLSSIVPVEDRKDVEITAKLFFLGSDGSQANVTESLDHLYRLLGISTIENLIVSAADQQHVLSAWPTLEELHKEGVIGRLGVSDFSQTDLKAFLGKVQVQPAVNQIELGQCCQLPRDLIAYAKANHIELLAHSDCSDILPKETLNKIMKAQHLISEDSFLSPRWVLKYTVFVKCRGIVADKGYIVMADK